MCTSNNRNRAVSTVSDARPSHAQGTTTTASDQQAGPFWTAPLWILAAAVLWGTTGTALALGSPAAHPVAVGTLRLLVGSPLLLLMFRPPRRLPAAALPSLFLGSLGIALYQPAFFLGVRANGVAIGTLLAIGSAPVAAAILQLVVERCVPPRRWILATALTLTGLTLLVQPVAAGRLSVAGMLASVGAGSSYALFVLATRRAIAHGLASHHIVSIAFTIAALLLAPTLVRFPLDWLGTPRGFASVLHLGIVATSIAYALFARGVARTSTATTATLSLAEPLTASLLATLVLGEDLDASRVVGAIVLLTGLATLALAEGSAKVQKRDTPAITSSTSSWREKT